MNSTVDYTRKFINGSNIKRSGNEANNMVVLLDGNHKHEATLWLFLMGGGNIAYRGRNLFGMKGKAWLVVETVICLILDSVRISVL